MENLPAPLPWDDVPLRPQISSLQAELNTLQISSQTSQFANSADLHFWLRESDADESSTFTEVWKWCPIEDRS